MCYEYIDSRENAQEKLLPAKGKFFSGISNKVISHQDYKHAQIIWVTFNTEDIGE